MSLADPDVVPRADAPDRQIEGAGMSRHLVWLLVSLAYVTVFPYYQQINNPNENVRIYMVRAIVEHHELNINRTCDELGYVNDKLIVDGRLYAGKAPGASFVGVPIYAVQRTVARWFGIKTLSKRAITLALRIFGVSVPLSVFFYFFARWVERQTGSGTARDLLVAGLGLGTILFPYGVIFVGHALGAALAFSGYMLLTFERDDRTSGRLAGAGFLVALSVFFEYQLVFAGVAITVYAFARHRRAALAFVLGALPAVLIHGVYHAVVFGKPWALPYAHIENPVFAQQPKQIGLPSPRVIANIWFSTDTGLFVFSPVLLVGLACTLGLVARGRKRDGLTFLAILVGMSAFVATLPNWHAGWVVGPRYISVVAPFLVAAIAYTWKTTRHRRALSIVTAGLIIPSVVINVLSGAVYPHYPEAFDNPIFDLTFPLLDAGYVPYSLGWLLGLPGLWSLLPLGLLAASAITPGLAGEDLRPRRWLAHAGLAIVIGALYLLPLSVLARTPRAEEASATALIRSTWEPPRARLTK